MNKKYPALSGLVVFFEAIAYFEIVVTVVVAGLIGFISIQHVGQIPAPFNYFASPLGLIFAIAIFITGIWHALWTLAICEFFSCIMDIEKNTRKQVE